MADAEFTTRLAAVEGAIGEGNWAEAIDLASAPPELRRNWRPGEQQDLSAAVMDWCGVLEAEARLLRREGLASCAELPVKQLSAGIAARIKLDLLDDAMDILAAAREQHVGSQRLLRQEAFLYFKAGQYDKAVTAYITLRNSGDGGQLHRIAQCLIEMNETARCVSLLSEAGNEMPSTGAAGLLRARCTLAEATGKPDEAVDLLQQRKDLLPASEHMSLLAHYAAAARQTGLLDTLLHEVARWTERDAIPGWVIETGPDVMLSHWQCCLDAAAVAPLLAKFENRLLPPSAARNIADLLRSMADFHRAVAVLERALGHFPSDVRNWQKMLSTLGAMGSNDTCATARQTMRRAIPPTSALSVMSRVSPDAWDPADVPDMIKLAERTIDQRVSTVFIDMLRRLSDPRLEISGAIEALVAESAPLDALRLEFILAANRDRGLMQRAVVETVPMSYFAQSRDETVRRTDAALARCADSTAIKTQDRTSAAWLRRCTGLLQQIEARSPGHILRTEESFGEALEFSRLLIEMIVSATPASILRLGDGEGHFLAADCTSQDIASDISETQRVWWGGRVPPAELSERLASDFRGAVESADIIGALPYARLARSAAKGGNDVVHRGSERSLAYLAAARPSQLIASALFPHDLRYWNLWEDIFAHVPSVSWISCHDLAPVLTSMFAAETRQKILIPPEERWSGLFRSAAAGQETTASLFDRHADICRDIAPRPGEVWLIAAGFLGKIYADIVKARGGIGIDIGSLADFWMGFRTRNFQLDVNSSLGFRTLCIPDHGIPDNPQHIVGRQDIARSSRTARFNAATSNDSAEAAAIAAQKKLLRVIGHPRCATGYMATAFNSLGLQIGHEKMLRDGISSWLGAARDLQVPYGDSCSHGFEFGHTVVCVRNPAAAIPSIVLENGIAPSFNFRRLHIMRECGIDIAAYHQPLARAAASFVNWYGLTDRLSPDLVVRAEDDRDVIRTWAADRLHRTAPAQTAAGLGKYNVTEGKARFALPKPVVAASDWLNLPDELLQKLEIFCARHRYSLPWAT